MSCEEERKALALACALPMIEKTDTADDSLIECFMYERICLFKILVEIEECLLVDLVRVNAGDSWELDHALQMFCEKFVIECHNKISFEIYSSGNILPLYKRLFNW